MFYITRGNLKVVPSISNIYELRSENMAGESLRKIIEEIIKEYNKYHSPEVVIKLLSMDKETVTLDFSGSFCQTCGFYDYFEDYQILLEKAKLNTKIIEINETNEGAIVHFQIFR